MFSKKLSNRCGTVRFRLTFMYLFLAVSLSTVAFAMFYISLGRTLAGSIDQFLAIEMEEMVTFYHRSTLEELAPWVVEEAKGEGVNRVFLQVLTTTGDVVCMSPSWSESSIDELARIPPELSIGEPIFRTITIPGRTSDIRTLYRQVSDQHVLQFCISMHETGALKKRIREHFGILLLIFTVGGGSAAWFVVNKAMSGVDRVTHTAVKIHKGDLSHRVPVGDEGQEIQQLANAFNGMLERVQSLVAELRDVTNNIAHDLRTPITRIRGIAETTLTGATTVNDYKRMAGSVIEDCDWLDGLINTMLDIAELESGSPSRTDEQVDLNTIVRNACDLFEPLAEDKDISMPVVESANAAIVNMSRQRLERVVANLLDNALKYTLEGGRVEVTVATTTSQVVMTIRDNGIGIARHELRHIARKFYRVDKSRSTRGHGLGLSLVRSIVLAHGGEISVESELGKGATFTVTLPLVHRGQTA